MLGFKGRACRLALMVVATLLSASAYAGAFRLDPGTHVLLDTDPQGFTTVYVRNLGQALGEVVFPDGQFSLVSVRPGETVELYGRVRKLRSKSKMPE